MLRYFQTLFCTFFPSRKKTVEGEKREGGQDRDRLRTGKQKGGGEKDGDTEVRRPTDKKMEVGMEAQATIPPKSSGGAFSDGLSNCIVGGGEVKTS